MDILYHVIFLKYIFQLYICTSLIQPAISTVCFITTNMKMAILGRNMQECHIYKLLCFYCCAIFRINTVFMVMIKRPCFRTADALSYLRPARLYKHVSQRHKMKVRTRQTALNQFRYHCLHVQPQPNGHAKSLPHFFFYHLLHADLPVLLDVLERSTIQNVCLYPQNEDI